MKKQFRFFFMFLVIGYTLTGCAQNQTPEEVKFKNPIFYETMDPLSKSTVATKITPTSIEQDLKKAGIAKGKCTLLENEDTYIVIICDIDVPFFGMQTHKMRYEIERCWLREEPNCELLIREDNFYLSSLTSGKVPEERIDGQSWYVVTQPKKD